MEQPPHWTEALKKEERKGAEYKTISAVELVNIWMLVVNREGLKMELIGLEGGGWLFCEFASHTDISVYSEKSSANSLPTYNAWPYTVGIIENLVPAYVVGGVCYLCFCWCTYFSYPIKPASGQQGACVIPLCLYPPHTYTVVYY